MGPRKRHAHRQQQLLLLCFDLHDFARSGSRRLVKLSEEHCGEVSPPAHDSWRMTPGNLPKDPEQHKAKASIQKSIIKLHLITV